MFIIWDRLFNTFQKEEEQPYYGLTTPVNSYNPIYLVFHEWVALISDLKHCKNYKEVFKMICYPPGAIITEHQRREQLLQKEK